MSRDGTSTSKVDSKLLKAVLQDSFTKFASDNLTVDSVEAQRLSKLFMREVHTGLVKRVAEARAEAQRIEAQRTEAQKGEVNHDGH